MTISQPRPIAAKAHRASSLVGAVRTLTLATALTATSIAVVATTASPEAHAFGLGDITGAAKKVGSAVKKGAKKTGGIAKKAAKGAIKYGPGAVKKGYETVTYAPRVFKKTHHEIVKTVVEEIGTRPTQEIARIIGKDYDDADWDELRRDVRNDYDRAKRKIRDIITGNNQIGESLPRPDNSKAKQALEDYANRRGSIVRRTFENSTMKTGLVKNDGFLDKRARTPMKGVARKTEPNYRWSKEFKNKSDPHGPGAVKFRTGVVNDGKFHGVRPGKPIGNDKSVWGRPLGGKKPIRKVTGITKDNLKRRGNRFKREIIGHDKSVFGRPIYRPKRKKIGNDKSIYGRPVYETRSRKASGKQIQSKRLNRFKNNAGSSRKRFDNSRRKSRSLGQMPGVQKRFKSNRSRFGNKKLRFNNRKSSRRSLKRGRRG